MTLREQIESYKPYNEQEERDKEQFLRFIDENEDVLTRENIIGHFSSSAFVVNKNRDKMLVVYHIINNGWIAPGGHADGEEDLLSVAVREVEEEKTIRNDEKTIEVNEGSYIGRWTNIKLLFIGNIFNILLSKYGFILLALS